MKIGKVFSWPAVLVAWLILSGFVSQTLRTADALLSSRDILERMLFGSILFIYGSVGVLWLLRKKS